jgi:hypothetical protein
VVGENLAVFLRCKMSLLMLWTVPAPGSELPYGDRCQRITSGSVPMQVTTIGLDIAKNVFQVHGIDVA